MCICRKIEGGNIAFYFATNFQPELTFWYMLVFILILISLIQSLSRVQQLWPHGLQYLPVHHQLLEYAQTHVL